MVLICTGDVCVLSKNLSPSSLCLLISSLTQKVSHTSRAWWLAGILSLSKLNSSVSICGPSSILNPREINISSRSSEVMLIGCLCHLACFQNSRVTSIFSFSSCSLNQDSSCSFCFFAIYPRIKLLSLFASGHMIFFSSFERSFIHLSISLSFPFFQRKSFSSCSRSVEVVISSEKSFCNSCSLFCMYLFHYINN